MTPSPEPYRSDRMGLSGSHSYVQPNINHTTASRPCSIAIQQHKRKSDHEIPRVYAKKQKSLIEQDEPIKRSPFNDVQPVGPSKAQEALTHGERWRLHTWNWPTK